MKRHYFTVATIAQHRSINIDVGFFLACVYFDLFSGQTGAWRSIVDHSVTMQQANFAVQLLAGSSQFCGSPACEQH